MFANHNNAEHNQASTNFPNVKKKEKRKNESEGVFPRDQVATWIHWPASFI